MKSINNLILSISPKTQPVRNPRKIASLALRQRHLYGKPRRHNTGKESDSETGLYYFGARYLDPKTSRWISGDPALGEYLPSAPVNDEAKKRNGNLPGMGGVFNYVNLHVYHYAGNNPVKYVDPDGKWFGIDDVLTGPVDEILVIGALLLLAALGNKKAKELLDSIENLIENILRPESITITDEAPDDNIDQSREHTSNARPSTRERHEQGRARQEADRDGRRGNSNPPRRRPEGHRGPWPPNGGPRGNEIEQ